MGEAVTMYRELLRREMRGPGDSEGAMWRLQARFGMDYALQWAMRYRPRKAIAKDAYDLIRRAYLATLEGSVRRDLEALKIEKAKGRADASLAGLAIEAETLLARIEEARS